ncbi:MAG: DUF4833 domain-containing protein [Bacteroidetes bacterium]|nr:DUF4833 domain-containing protein [Bacteroidota bacterium]
MKLNGQTTYPIPNNKSVLFYIQRSLDINTIVYELNYNRDSTINISKPIKVFWIKYAEHSQVEALSGLQKKYAYGVTCKLTDSEKKWFKVKLKAYSKVDIYIMNSENNKNYQAYLNINGQLVRLTKIFINIDGGTFWKPNVTYIELFGQNITTNEVVKEKIKP